MQSSALKASFISSARGKIAYQEIGEGPALVLIHGGGPGATGASNYARNALALADRGNRVIVIDLPGYGQSEVRSLEEGLYVPLAQATLDLMDGLRIDKASFVGNSLGGGTALRLALDHPDRADKLILMGPGGGIPATSPFPSEGLRQMLTFYDGEGPTREKLDRVLNLLVHDRSKITPELVEQRFAAATLPETLANPPLKAGGLKPSNALWRADLDKLTHPTLLIWGREDQIIPLDVSFLFLKRIPKAELHVFPQCGHWVQWEKADEFNELVANFLERQ